MTYRSLHPRNSRRSDISSSSSCGLSSFKLRCGWTCFPITLALTLTRTPRHSHSWWVDLYVISLNLFHPGSRHPRGLGLSLRPCDFFSSSYVATLIFSFRCATAMPFGVNMPPAARVCRRGGGRPPRPPPPPRPAIPPGGPHCPGPSERG